MNAISDTSYSFEPVILERDQWFAFKILVLHPEKAKPRIGTFGKIAGIAQFELAEAAPATRPSFVSRVFSGDLIIQLVRVIAYFVGTALLLIAGGLSGTALVEWYQKRRRRRYVKRFKRGFTGKLGKKQSAILDRYTDSGEEFLVEVCKLLRDFELLSQALTEVEAPVIAGGHDARVMEMSGDLVEVFQGGRWKRRVARFLVDEKIVTREADAITVEEDMLDFVNRFEAFLLALVPNRIRYRGDVKHSAQEDSPSDASSASLPTTPHE